LKPVLRVIDNLQVGTISGAVDPALIAASCPENLSAPYPGSVYLFGPVPTATTVTPDDYDGIAEDPNGDDALTSALVDPNTFQYTIGFVPAGDYVVAYRAIATAATSMRTRLTIGRRRRGRRVHAAAGTP
jgi:hypothetical protein